MGCGGSKDAEAAHTEDEPKPRVSERWSERVSTSRNSMAQRTAALGNALEGMFGAGKVWKPSDDYVGDKAHTKGGTHANYKTESVKEALEKDRKQKQKNNK